MEKWEGWSSPDHIHALLHGEKSTKTLWINFCLRAACHVAIIARKLHLLPAPRYYCLLVTPEFSMGKYFSEPNQNKLCHCLTNLILHGVSMKFDPCWALMWRESFLIKNVYMHGHVCFPFLSFNVIKNLSIYYMSQKQVWVKVRKGYIEYVWNERTGVWLI